MNQINQVLASEKVVVAQSALIAMSQIMEGDRSRVLQTLAALATASSEEWPTDKVHPRLPQKGIDMLDATEQLRVFFLRENDGTLTIVDWPCRKCWIAISPADRQGIGRERVSIAIAFDAQGGAIKKLWHSGSFSRARRIYRKTET